MTPKAPRAERALEVLEYDLAREFVGGVEGNLRRLSDTEINELYLRTHTDALLGETVDV